MEHRYSTRFPADHKALIFKNGMPIAIGRIRNFSRGGIFVKTEFDLIDVNQSLDIELIARSNNGRASIDPGARCLCKTLVMHKADGGVGLMMRDECAETLDNFAAFIAEELERYQRIEDGQAATVAVPLVSAINLTDKNLF